MRIAYDDAKQPEMVRVFEEFVKSLSVKSLRLYENGMNRIQRRRVWEQLDLRFQQFKFSLGSTATHANGIGNSCKYPVYYTGAGTAEGVKELQVCGFVNINVGMYGECYMSCEDFDGRKISKLYEIRANWGVKEA